MSIYDKGISGTQSHDVTDADAPSQMIGTVGVYALAPYSFSEQSFIQLIGMPGGFGEESMVCTIKPIYMTVTKIPKI